MTVVPFGPPTRAMWFLPEFPPDSGGIAVHAKVLAPALQELGHEVFHLVSQGDSAREVVDGVVVVREPLRDAFGQGSAVVVMRCRRLVADLKSEWKPGVYHVHLSDPTPMLHLATAGVAPAPTVLTMHNLLSELLPVDDPDSVVRRLLEMSGVVIGVSVAAVDLATAALPHLAHRMVAIPNGVDVPEAVVPLPHEPRLLAIGRLASQKAFDRLLLAMPTILERHTETHLDILGDGPDRPMLESLIDRLGLGPHVTLQGQIDRSQVAGFIDRSQLVVAPSRHEGIPYALLEAAGQGRPIVGTRTGGIDEVVVDGETGLLVDQVQMDGDPGVLAAAVITVLDDHARAARWGAAARDRVERWYSLSACAAAHDLVYRSVTSPVADIAVIVPAWNAGRHLRATLESILVDVSATGVSAQVLVVDDGSTDDTFDVAAEFTADGVEVFRQPNQGSAVARNRGLALTRSRYVAHFDADDLWPRGRLDALLAPLEADLDLDAVFGSAVEFADPDAPANARWSPEPTAVRMPSVGVLRREVHDRFGAFAPGRTNDQLGWSTSALASGLRYSAIDDVVLHRRIHSTNNSHRHPFRTDRDRVAILKAALDARRHRD